MSPPTAGVTSGLVDLAYALVTVVVVPLVVLALGKAFDAAMRAWGPDTDPEDRLYWRDD